jgi:hypothetical protein
MTQARGQEPLLTTLHPLPAGSRIMGGQEKSQRHLGRGNPGQPPRLDCFRSTTVVSNAQPYPEEHTAAVDKKPGILIARDAVVLTCHKSIQRD